MILKGIVTSIQAGKARVTFQDRDNTESAPLIVASNVGIVNINDNVVTAFFSDSMEDGVIIARW